jgi:hypothetical protein
MAKFIAVQPIDRQEINKDAFKKFTSEELKKTFKCEKVEELKYCNKSNSKLAEFATISEHKLIQLSSTLTETDLEDMTENRYGTYENTKIFILSEDASATALAFDVLKNNCIIKLFQLDNEEITNFTNSIEIIQSEDESISSLNKAKNLCESLNEIESDFGLSLLYDSSISEIDEKISDIESDVETSKEFLDEIFELQWN